MGDRGPWGHGVSRKEGRVTPRCRMLRMCARIIPERRIRGRKPRAWSKRSRRRYAMSCTALQAPPEVGCMQGSLGVGNADAEIHLLRLEMATLISVLAVWI